MHEKTGISEDTLQWLTVEKGRPSFKLGKKIVVYPADELAVWIDNQRSVSTKGDVL